jgi:hypothetical protein
MEKNQTFIAVLMFGAGIVVSPLFIDRFGVFVGAILAVVFALIMYLAYLVLRAIPSAYQRYRDWRGRVGSSPKIQWWYDLPYRNVLRLHIVNPLHSREFHVECSFKQMEDTKGTNYLHSYSSELHLMEDASGGNPPFFSATLEPRAGKQIIIGMEHEGKIALYIGDAHVFGFRDGIFRYVVECQRWEKHKRLTPVQMPNWITIEGGKLTAIHTDREMMQILKDDS